MKVVSKRKLEVEVLGHWRLFCLFFSFFLGSSAFFCELSGRKHRALLALYTPCPP